MKWKLILIAAVIAAILGSFFLGQNRGVKITDKWYRDHMDTTTTVQIDTNKVEVPVADTEYVDRPVYIPVYTDPEIPEPQIIYRDSVHYVLMERVIKEYRTEDYFAKISGVEPNLDYIETYNKTVTNTVYVPQKITSKTNYFALEGTLMYDIIPMAPVTFNVGYRKGLLDVSAGIGYDFIQRDPVVKSDIRIMFNF
jgi:hypothetical protein